jgi:hypothetical protein
MVYACASKFGITFLAFSDESNRETALRLAVLPQKPMKNKKILNSTCPCPLDGEKQNEKNSTFWFEEPPSYKKHPAGPTQIKKHQDKKANENSVLAVFLEDKVERIVFLLT